MTDREMRYYLKQLSAKLDFKCKPSVRSRVTIEDLGSKSGTRVNDQKIKGEKYVLADPINTLQMGSFHDKFKYLPLPPFPPFLCIVFHLVCCVLELIG